MRSLFFIVTLLFISSFSFAKTTNSSANCLMSPEWHIFVTSNMPDDIQVHVYAYGRDERRTLNFGETYDWYFCPTVQKWWNGDFAWGSTNVDLSLYSKHIQRICYHYKPIFGTQHCYWLARPEGFYVSRHNSPFPNSDWHFERSWS